MRKPKVEIIENKMADVEIIENKLVNLYINLFNLLSSIVWKTLL